MMQAIGWRALVGRSAKSMLLLGGAIALHALRTRSRTRAGELRHDDARKTGITDLPPQDEAAQQDALPPRGSRKDGVHA